ncbi:MAG: metal-dependent hydrolase [Planctomycetota bacterium]|nr:MAG: metal-dependent hydrolase [Planctomycetota bacterium]
MAAFREHVIFSSLLGVSYGAVASLGLHFTPVQGALAAVMTGVAGMLPDLDLDHGKPARELFGLLAAVAPLLLVGRILQWLHLPADRETVMLAIVVLYMLIRYQLAFLVAKFCVHRGMFHSIPALIIAAELAYLTYPSESTKVKLLVGTGVALGFFSHLLLDEIYSVEIDGLKVGLKKSSGTAIKMFGEAFWPNVVAFAMAATLSYATLQDAGLIREAPQIVAPPPGPSSSLQSAQGLPDDSLR